RCLKGKSRRHTVEQQKRTLAWLAGGRTFSGAMAACLEAGGEEHASLLLRSDASRWNKVRSRDC
ncbi:unnamed protein product, partial [Ectocarpus sp. 12 AP-2014]